MDGESRRGVPFTQLHHVHVTNNNDDRVVIAPKQARRYCGVQGKIILAAILLILIIIIFTAAIVMVAVAHADKKLMNVTAETQQNTDNQIPPSERIRCPLKTQKACIAGGCLYNDNERGPECFYPKNYYTLSNSSSWKDITTSQNIVNVEIDESSDIASLSVGYSQRSKRLIRRETPHANYIIKYNNNFGFQLRRKNSSEILFDLKGKPCLNVMKYFIHIILDVPKGSKAYGLGNFERYIKLFDDSVYTIWSRKEQENAHPFIMLQSPIGNSFSGLFIDSTYPMDIQLKKSSQISITILATGVKIYLFTGPTSTDVVAQYWSKIKKPVRPLYWGMGNFYGSESISSHDHLIEMFKNHTKLDQGIPIEGVILSGSLNQDNQPFTLGNDVLNLLKKRHEEDGISFIVTVPPVVTKSSGNANRTWFMYTAGIDQKVYLTNDDNTPIYGMYGDKMSLYPDFTASNVNSWWQKNISILGDYGRFGYHMYKNTPYNQVNGSIGLCDDLETTVGLASDLLSLPNLEANTICISAKGRKGNQLEKHNRFGFDQVKVTYSVLTPWSVSARPLIISDSTSAGIGAYAGHLYDSNANSYKGLRSALAEMVTYNLLAVPFTGPNLCTKEMISVELCQKWYYLSVIAPLSWSISLDVAHIFNSSVASHVTRTLQFRQRLLPYHYDAFYKAESSSKVPLRFLSFDYPMDQKALLYQDQVLLGEGILYSPVLRSGETYRVAYLPNATWCNWIDGACYIGPREVQVYSDNAPESFTFLKGGSAIVTQKSARTISNSRTQNVRLITVLDRNGAANHTQFFDDGETANTLYSKYYSLVNYVVVNNTLTVKHLHNGYLGRSMKVKYEKIFVYGLTKKVTKLKLNNEEVKFNCLMGGETEFYKLVISSSNVDVSLNQQFTFLWEFD